MYIKEIVKDFAQEEATEISVYLGQAVVFL